MYVERTVRFLAGPVIALLFAGVVLGAVPDSTGWLSTVVQLLAVVCIGLPLGVEFAAGRASVRNALLFYLATWLWTVGALLVLLLGALGVGFGLQAAGVDITLSSSLKRVLYLVAATFGLMKAYRSIYGPATPTDLQPE